MDDDADTAKLAQRIYEILLDELGDDGYSMSMVIGAVATVLAGLVASNTQADESDALKSCAALFESARLPLHS
jgi:hypothetical protein